MDEVIELLLAAYDADRPDASEVDRGMYRLDMEKAVKDLLQAGFVLGRISSEPADEDDSVSDEDGPMLIPLHTPTEEHLVDTINLGIIVAGGLAALAIITGRRK